MVGKISRIFILFVTCESCLASQSTEYGGRGNIMEKPSKCRVSNGIFLEPELFSLYTCANCYKFMEAGMFCSGRRLSSKLITLMDESTNQTYYANVSDTTSPIWLTFISEKAKDLWQTCCEQAVICCQTMRETPLKNDVDHCPRTWDGWYCWQDTPKGTTVQTACPWYVYMHNDAPLCTRYATKICHENATWYRNSDNHEWSNYTSCSQKNDIHDLRRGHIISFAVSVILLVPALFIFFRYKQLRVIRISMHKNLFFSLLANAICVIIVEGYFMKESITTQNRSIFQANEIGCKVFYTATKYFRLSSFMWMLCEGIYLHKLIAAAFAEQKSMIMFYLIGWGFPFIPIIIWATVRQLFADSGCWAVAHDYDYILIIPTLTALTINVIFLANIIRILYVKLKSSHASEPSQFRRAVKATIVLIPLFGIHIILVMYHPNKGHCLFTHIYVMVSHCLDGLQGAIVASIFCYFNKEVIFLLKNSYRRRKLIRTVGSEATNSKRVSRMGSRVSISTMTSVVNSYMDKKRASK